MHRPCTQFVTPAPARHLAGVVAWALVAIATLVAAGPASAAGLRAAEALIQRAQHAMRVDPDASRRDAEGALAVLAREPNADLEIRARLILCDYYAERDANAAREEIARSIALLPQAARQGLRAGVLTCEGDLNETAGDNAQASVLYERAVAVGADTKDDEMLAEALFSRGYLRGVQGQFSTGLADLRRAQSLFEKNNMPQHAMTV